MRDPNPSSVWLTVLEIKHAGRLHAIASRKTVTFIVAATRSHISLEDVTLCRIQISQTLNVTNETVFISN
jgi:hypothetical protein